ncbi:MAG: FkbM family methyltransferase [Microscillaceae bacterium]|nr:FkbM family methyltransferase [Microscillaceae bacterium]
MRQWRKLQNYLWLRVCQRIHPLPTECLGSVYGGWVIPQDLLHPEAVCCLAGAGLDISLDVAIAEKYQSQVFIFDPTPKAKSHFEELCQNISEGSPAFLNQKESYALKKENIAHLHFVELGLWNQSGRLKFYEPANPAHVSHSALNIQKTEKYFEAEVIRLREWMQAQHLPSLDLLKLDIEGAEYQVIDSVLEDRLDIKVICVEFDEIHFPMDRRYLSRIWQRLKALEKNGYSIVALDMNYNFTFVRKDVYKTLKNK